MLATTQSRKRPSWDELFAVAGTQGGYFTTAQAAQAGYSPPLLHKYLANWKIARTRRGVYRLVHFPSSEHEDLIVLWLWAERQGLFSHETALALHDLSDILPGKIHMTLPLAWRQRRLQVPAGLMLHFADVGSPDRTFHGEVPITTPRRTIQDCIAAEVAPELVRQALFQSRRRGILSPQDAKQLEQDLDHLSAAM